MSRAVARRLNTASNRQVLKKGNLALPQYFLSMIKLKSLLISVFNERKKTISPRKDIDLDLKSEKLRG
jgi:hypothetical protein